MGIIIMGVKFDDVICECIKFVVSCIDCMLYWLIKQVIFNYLEKLENDEMLFELLVLFFGVVNESDDVSELMEEFYQLFFEFVEQILLQLVSCVVIIVVW